MGALEAARLQFTMTTVFHFFFVPITLGLTILVAIFETQYVRTGNEMYKRMTKFWGKLMLINFAIGVVTGIALEFEFGMNWSEYSRYVGDIFGAPLAVEALMAFFIESTFLGVWIFGWDRLSKGAHLASMWLVAIASNVSAFWILVANSWMQEPVGYIINEETGRAEMTDFIALITNPHVWVQFPHVVFSGFATAAFLVMGVSAWHFMRKTPHVEFFKKSFQYATVYGTVGAVMVLLVGHSQAQHMVRAQPMKMAAAEALWDTEAPAAMSLFTIGDETEREDIFAIHLPGVLSLLACNNFECEVQGINDLQAQYEEEYGPGDYVPPVIVAYWSFRIMVGAGMLMLVIAFYALYLVMQNKVLQAQRFLWILPLAIFLPHIANASGWILTEVGRQPWIVFGLLRVEDAVSNVSAGTVWLTIFGFLILYTALFIPYVILMRKFATSDPYTGDSVVPGLSPDDADTAAPAVNY